MVDTKWRACPARVERLVRPTTIGMIGWTGDVAYRHLTDVPERRDDVRFSNRPFGVKRFQTIHHYSVDVAHGLVLLYGIGTKALPSWGSRRGGTIFGSALPLDER